MTAAALNEQEDSCVVFRQCKVLQTSEKWAVMWLPLLVETNQAATIHAQQLIACRQIPILHRGDTVRGSQERRHSNVETVLPD